MPDTVLSEKTGRVFNIERFSTHDGPGIRTTVFLKGCPLRCDWCHNPEGLSPDPQVIYISRLCIGCGICRAVCPCGCIAQTAEGFVASGACTHCGACVTACPAKARELFGRDMSDSEVLQEVLRDRMFYEESGGGVTFSGGEPLMQADFLFSCLRLCREKHLHTAVDTSGYAEQAELERIAPYVDLFLYDLKAIDAELHKRCIGVDNTVILDNLKFLARNGRTVWIRIPVIPDVNDTADTMGEIAGFLRQNNIQAPVFLLPFHNAGAEKYKNLHMNYAVTNTKAPAEERMQALAELFIAQGFDIRTGG